MARRAPVSGSRAMPTAGTPTSWSPAYDSTPGTTVAAAGRSGAPRCARQTAIPSATPQVSSSLQILAIAHDGPFTNDGASSRREVEQRDQEADDADDHENDPDG